MRKLTIRAAAALLAAALFFPVGAGAISAEKAVLMDGTTGQFLYERRGGEQSLIASTTKIMTALVVCQQCNVLDRVKIPGEAVGIEGSSMYLREGEVLTVQELLYGLMLSSGNDAAVALAIYCGGTVEGFCQLMNDKARTLGLEDTHFSTPNGLDAPDNYSTARDLAVLAAHAMEDPIFAKTVSTRQIQVGERYLTNHNKLLWQVEGADGVKTGYTRAAGRILVSSATRDGRRLVCVTINAPDDWKDHAALLNEGFSRYSAATVVEAGEVLGHRAVEGGDGTAAVLLAGEGFGYALAEGEVPVIELTGPDFAYAPVVRGGEAGWAYIKLGDTVIGRVPLVYGSTVEQVQERKKTLWEKWFGA